MTSSSRCWALAARSLGAGLLLMMPLASCDEGEEFSVLRRQGGERLVPKYFSGADGSRQFRAWHDTELDILCSFRRVHTLDQGDERHYRCLPYLDYPDRERYFEDSECTSPVTVAFTYYDCEDPKDVEYTLTRTRTCGEAPEIRKVTSAERVDPQDQLWRKNSEGSSVGAAGGCTEVSEFSKEQMFLIEEGDLVDIERFVLGTEERGE